MTQPRARRPRGCADVMRSGPDENRTRLMLIDSEPTSPDVPRAREKRRTT